MKNLICWLLVAVMLCVMCMCVSSPALAEVTPLPLDQTVPGNPLPAGNWKQIAGKDALSNDFVLSFGTAKPYILKYSSKTRTWTETNKAASASKFEWKYYEDGSISARTEYATLIPAYENAKIQSSITYIKIADPSQIRTAMTLDRYDKKVYKSAVEMAKQKNAVVALNGDHFKYHYDVGYVVRQGEFYRDKLDGQRDALIIDSNGDFHGVMSADSASIAAAIEALPEGVTVVNTFTLGPVLVENGEARVMKETSVAKSGKFQWCYPQQRIAIAQLGELEYAVIETYGKTSGKAGMTLQEFSDYIQYLFPECIIAYNLDGGGSTNVVVNNKMVESTPGHREISDIIYFASAWTE